jgi:hypothetical protein
MKTTNKVILINLGILAGLAFELYQGAPLKIVSLVGTILLLFTNLVIYISGKRKRRAD